MSAQQTMHDSARAAGWFTDPLDDARIRYWNGESWTDQTAARVDLPPPVGTPHPAPATPGPGTPPSAPTPGNLAGPPPPGGYAPAGYAPQSYPYGADDQYGSGELPGAVQRSAIGRSAKAKRGRSGSGSVGLRANMFTTAAVVFGILALVFMPLYVGVIAIASAAVAFVRGERRAATGLKIAILGMVVGIAWAYASARFGLAI